MDGGEDEDEREATTDSVPQWNLNVTEFKRVSFPMKIHMINMVSDLDIGYSQPLIRLIKLFNSLD